LSAGPHLHRLKRLEDILAQSRSAPTRTGSDGDGPVQLLAATVPTERIGKLTSEQHERTSEPIDDVDNLTMRILLDDYTEAVAILRAIARLAEQRIANAGVPIEQTRRFVRRELKPKPGPDGTS
jgi:hypothetical protein